MAIGPRLEFRQTQSLVMTPQLRQAIKLLASTNLEAAAFVAEELERNPLLDAAHQGASTPEAPAIDQRPAATEGVATDIVMQHAIVPDGQAEHGNTHDTGTFADGYARSDLSHSGGRRDPWGTDDRGVDDLSANPPTLRAHIAEQLHLAFSDPADRLIGTHFMAQMDAAGRVLVSTGEIAAALGADPARVAHIRAAMQQFDPPGLFTQTLQQCLAAQLRDRNRLDPAMQALLDHLDLLARRDLRGLMAVCAVDAEDMADMIGELRALNPKPALLFEHDPPAAIVPDVLMRALPDGSWQLELNPETMPRVLVNQAYHARVSAQVRQNREARVFLSEQLASANWLVKSLQQRATTILKVAAEVVRQQDGFFRRGVGHLRPLILRDVAGEVDLHESTVSRVTANKYIMTPRGTFELKYFFTASINATHGGEGHSAEAVRHRIRALVSAENAGTVLSDDAIVSALRREGVDIARRTVAKYRDALRIPSSVQRKREKAMPA